MKQAFIQFGVNGLPEPYEATVFNFTVDYEPQKTAALTLAQIMTGVVNQFNKDFAAVVKIESKHVQIKILTVLN